MIAGEAHAVRAGRRKETRGRRGRAAARKRDHLRDREAQRAQARRRLRNPYYYTTGRAEAGHSASGAMRVSMMTEPHIENFREVQKAVGPLHAYHLRVGTGERRRQLRRTQ